MGKALASDLPADFFFCCNAAPAKEDVIYCKTRPVHDDRSRIESLIHELFCLQDLNSDGFLDEEELVTLNERIAILHYGSSVDRAEIRAKYVALFRQGLDPAGHPVPVETFQGYMAQVLAEIDHDLVAQEMIVEQWVAEAATARSFCGEAPTCLVPIVDEFISEGCVRGCSWELDSVILGDGAPSQVELPASASSKDHGSETSTPAEDATLSTCYEATSPRCLTAIEDSISE
eukprot:CAMPEP_0115511022 /NCGR_PEP_ID=MMETSP0271-20121206/73742_1 /TAXON_ID=71861 /ORGANISM="Scrippsiella trochoidea, Strain CCMP3099" /LENGTH=231 /DNA_ID=CAMNT_0002941061 /DNA_START=9 /DNA_END=701 /DNA_ORIENTATION=-